MSNHLETIDQTNVLISQLQLLEMAARGMQDREESAAMQEGVVSAIDMIRSIKELLTEGAADSQ